MILFVSLVIMMFDCLHKGEHKCSKRKHDIQNHDRNFQTKIILYNKIVTPPQPFKPRNKKEKEGKKKNEKDFPRQTEF